MDIRVADLENPEVLALLREHLASLAPTAPAESRHVFMTLQLTDSQGAGSQGN